MAARLWFIGSLLVALGLAARMLGWDVLLWIPQTVMDVIREDPATSGVITLGIVLMVIARLIGQRRG
ncbi:hypothetical protein [Roseomonas sp. KE0001]|uniref:hypothetical protein n=1 Tax=Roseomonas sp. KE0001 TaxID=2479201 RepID=UPI0018DFCF73|nr:hypothetical protein [Roseomonas sp. KE0001]MBI0433871.1 hypothetical protein [Roseomonas sp. KE0001]